jgi:hypothetical protein
LKKHSDASAEPADFQVRIMQGLAMPINVTVQPDVRLQIGEPVQAA